MRIGTWVPFVAVVAAFGCSKRERIQRHEENAVEHQQEAREELTKGQERANRDVIAARKDSHDEQMKAIEEQNKAEALREELRGQDVEPVAGKMPTFENSLRDKLGDDWTVMKHGNGYIATRQKIKTPDPKFNKKVADECKDFANDYKDATVVHQGEMVTMRGRIDDCGKAAGAADEFAEIDGINKIVLDISCAR